MPPQKRDEQAHLLLAMAPAWGQGVIHVFDQGEALALWLELLLAFSLRFVLGFRKDYDLLDAAGNRRLTWKIARGQRGWSQRWVWDARQSWWALASVVVLQVAHPDPPERPLYLVVCREPRTLALVSAHR
jgi:hypothetical protein